jgi:hypothetical protein
MLEKISYVLPQKIQTSTVVEELATLIILVIFQEFVSKPKKHSSSSNIHRAKLNGIAGYIADKFNINDSMWILFYKKKTCMKCMLT